MQRNRRRLFSVCVVLVGSVAAASARAEDETAAVRAAAREYAAAVANGDAEKIRASWTEDGDYVDAAGRVHRVRNLVKQMAGRQRGGKVGSDAAPVKSSLRFVAPTVAIEDGEYDCGVAGNGGAMTGRFTAVWVKQGERWLLDSLRESVSAAPLLDEQLRPLAWMLGEWVAEADDAVMLLSARASEHGNFIVREFAVIGDGGETTATERIAWDPADRELKSWTFDSQDGRGESSWSRDGKDWRVETTEVMDDGGEALTVAVITRVGDDRHTWEVKSSKIGGESVPSRRVEFKRAAE
jgi:uncharacterized protein (TIGR02246 family)